jgi:hypothetical protein
MFGKTPRLSALELRKRLLIAESELNRAQLSDEWRKTTEEVLDLAHRAKTIAVWSSSAAMLMAGLAAFRSPGARAAEDKPSWFQRLLEYVRLADRLLTHLPAAWHRRCAQPADVEQKPKR